jgi:hypothetical protein
MSTMSWLVDILVQYTLHRHHKISSWLLYPPIEDVRLSSSEKENVILSIRRSFSGLYNDKRYDVLIDAHRAPYMRLLERARRKR